VVAQQKQKQQSICEKQWAKEKEKQHLTHVKGVVAIGASKPLEQTTEMFYPQTTKKIAKQPVQKGENKNNQPPSSMWSSPGDSPILGNLMVGP